MVQSTSPYAVVYQKIGYYRANSNDASFHQYLDQKLEEAEKGLRIPEELAAELDANYARYLQVAANMNPNQSASQGNAGLNNGYNSVLPKAGSVANQGYIDNYETEKTKRTNVEIKIGAGVLSVIGAVFVLIALVYFGTYFLKDIFQGIAIYAGGAVIILVSELILSRKFKTFSHILTGIGFCALYFATLFCFLELKLFDLYVALGIIAGIALINVVFARLKKSQIMEVVCSIASLAPVYVMKGSATFEQFICVAALIVVINAITICIPTKERRSVPVIIGQTAMTAGYFWILFGGFTAVSELQLTIFAGVCAVFILMSFAIHNKYPESEAFAIIYAGLIALSCVDSKFVVSYKYIAILVAVFAGCLISFLMLVKKKQKWAMYYFFLYFAFIMFIFAKDPLWTAAVFLGVLVLTKLVSNIKDTEWYDVVLSSLILVAACLMKGNYLIYAIFGVALIGLLMCAELKLFQEFLLAITGMIVIARSDFGMYTMPIWMAWLMLLVLLANVIPTMKVKGTIAFNITAMVLIGAGILFTPIAATYGHTNNMILFGCSAVVGIVCSLGFFRKKFSMDTPVRYTIMAIVLTYLAYFMDIDQLYISISLMAVAFISIAVGCIANRFELRLYGLVLSFLVCIKVAFYDFEDENQFNRMIVFLVVGLLAIAISVVYLILEKHEQKQMKALKAAAQAPAVQAVPEAPVVPSTPEAPVAQEAVINPLPEADIINVENNDIQNDTDEENVNCEEEQQ